MRLSKFTHSFAINGLNLERFLNLIQKRQIPLLSVFRKDARTLVCECYSADLSVIRQLAADKGWRIEAVEPLGFSALGLRLKQRPGIPIGIALALVCMLVFTQFVWRIEIRQAGPYQADIVSFLQESGYHKGVPRKSVDAKALENALIQRYPQIAWFHVHVSNITLVVDATPGVPLPDEKSTEPGDVIAEQDGIIQSIRVYAGTAVVKAGDVVRKGDLLIRGEERSADGMLKPVHADGVVTARCWDSRTVSMPLYEIRTSETGQEYRFNRIRTPWFNWPSSIDQPAYLASNLYVTETPIIGAYFPVFFQTATLREVSMEYTPRDVAEVRKEACDAAEQQLKNDLFGDEIIDKWVDYCMIEDDTLAATVTAERLVDIGAFLSP